MLDWSTFMRRPAAFIEAARLAACFSNELRPELCARLREASRLQDRLSTLITKHYALPVPVAPEAVSEIDRKVALLPTPRLADLIRRSGAMYWANAIANVVLADEVRLLHEQLGEALCAFARTKRELSGPGVAFAPLAQAPARVVEDGERCLSAWCQSQPEAVAARVRLKFAPGPDIDGAPPGPFAELGPAIVRTAAG